MTQSQYQTARGSEQPFAVQFSVFLANRVGQLKELLDIMSEENVSAVGVSVVDSTDWAVIRIVFSDPNKAREVLRKYRVPFTESEVLLVVLVGDEALADVCGVLLRAEINVHFAYPLILCRQDNPVMVFHVDDHVLAIRALVKHGFTLLGHEDLADRL